VAEIKRLDLGNLNPIYERELNKPDVHQMKGRWNVSKDGEGGKGCRHKEPEGGEVHEPTVGDEGGAAGHAISLAWDQSHLVLSLFRLTRGKPSNSLPAAAWARPLAIWWGPSERHCSRTGAR
jgi:hypothetical protein